MLRQARLKIPGIPLHITQRGVNRCAIFLDYEDRHHYLRLLAGSAANHGLQIHAYVLMGNHVHLLVSFAEPGKVSLAMRQLGQACITAFNRRHRRTGTLWEGRFKSCLVDSDRYLLTAYRYIELNLGSRGDGPAPRTSPLVQRTREPGIVRRLSGDTPRLLSRNGEYAAGTRRGLPGVAQPRRQR
jgi:REP element-mobilizing transposase RayT